MSMTMMRRAAVFALALLPLAASAQPVPMRPGAPGSSPQGITVQGRATVRYAVKTVQFVGTAHGNPDEAGALAAMRAAGVDDPVVGPLGSQMNSNAPTILRGTVRDVSQAKLARLSRAAADYGRAHPGASLDRVDFFAAPETCAPHEQEARSAALADARRKAQALAALAGVTLEGVVAVNEAGGCPSPADSGYPMAAQYGQPIDIGTLTASVAITEYVTFAISQGTPANRRRTL